MIDSWEESGTLKPIMMYCFRHSASIERVTHLNHPPFAIYGQSPICPAKDPGIPQAVHYQGSVVRFIIEKSQRLWVFYLSLW